jgi:quinol monooxygenase YgiN
VTSHYQKPVAAGWENRKGAAMFGLVVRFTLTEDGASGFDQLVKELVPSIQRDEPGTIVYATHTVEGQPNLRVFYELYRDREAFDEHERQAHTRRFLAEREQYLVGPADVDFVTLQAAAGIAAANQEPA